MKKLLFVIVLLTAVSCTTDFREDHKPKTISGAKIQIDSTQWTPALIKVNDGSVTIYENSEIREIILWNPVWVFITGFFIMAFIALMVTISKD